MEGKSFPVSPNRAMMDRKSKSGGVGRGASLLQRRHVTGDEHRRQVSTATGAITREALVDKFTQSVAQSTTADIDDVTSVRKHTHAQPLLANRAYTCLTQSGTYIQDEFIGSSHRLPKLSRCSTSSDDAGSLHDALLYNHFHLLRCALCHSSYVYRDKPALASVPSDWDSVLTTTKHGSLLMCPCQGQHVQQQQQLAVAPTDTRRQFTRLTLPDVFKLQVYKDVRNMRDYVVSSLGDVKG